MPNDPTPAVNAAPTPEVVPQAPPKPVDPPINPMADKLNKLLSGFDKDGKKKSDDPKPAEPVTPVTPPADKPADPAAAAPADDGVPEAIKNPTVAANFRKIKADREEFRLRAEKAESRLKELESKPAISPDFERLENENKQISEQLRLLAIERHPRFQAHFNNKLKVAVDLAKRAVGQELSSKIEQVLNMPESEARSEEIETIMSDLSPLQQGRLASAVSVFDNVAVERESEIAKAKSDYETYSKQLGIGEDPQAAFLKQASEAVEVALSKAGMMESFKEGADPASKSGVAERMQFVRDFAQGKLEPSIYPWVPILAAEAMYLRETKLPEMEKKVKEMEAQLAAVQSGSPSPSGGIAGDRTQTKSSGFIEKFKKNWPGE